MVFAFLRSLLFLLPFALFGRVVCVENSDGTWTCSGEGDSPVYPPDIVITNGLGVCVNCIQISKAECESFKVDLAKTLSVHFEDLKNIRSDLKEVLDSVVELRKEGETFSVTAYNGDVPPEYSSWAEWVRDVPEFEYYLNYAGVKSTSGISRSIVGAANNSVANYYQTAVSPVLDNVVSVLGHDQDVLNEMEYRIDRLKKRVDDIECEECSFDVSGGGGVGGGGGGGDGSSGCGPCLEQLKALNEVVKTIDGRIEGLGFTVGNISTNVNDLLTLFRQYASNVTNSLGRIDSYLRDDLDRYAQNLVSSVLVISNNVDGLQRDFFQAMKYAAEFKNADGTKSFDPVEISTNFLEAAYYKDLPWAARVEALLLKIASPFDNSDAIEDPQADEKIKDVRDALDKLNPAESVSVFSASSETVFGSLSRAVGSVAGIFNYAHNPKEVRILESDQWIGEQELVINLSDEVVDPIRAVFRLIWAVAALFMLFVIWVFVMKTVLPMFRLAQKLVTFVIKA